MCGAQAEILTAPSRVGKGCLSVNMRTFLTMELMLVQRVSLSLRSIRLPLPGSQGQRASSRNVSLFGCIWQWSKEYLCEANGFTNTGKFFKPRALILGSMGVQGHLKAYKIDGIFLCCFFLVHFPVNNLLEKTYTQKFQRIVQ